MNSFCKSKAVNIELQKPALCGPVLSVRVTSVTNNFRDSDLFSVYFTSVRSPGTATLKNLRIRDFLSTAWLSFRTVNKGQRQTITMYTQHEDLWSTSSHQNSLTFTSKIVYRQAFYANQSFFLSKCGIITLLIISFDF